MALEEDVIKLLKSEGYRMNETIRDALGDFLDIVYDENEEMEDDLDDEEDDEEPAEER